MSSDRRSAIWVGILYIVATAFPVAALAPWSALVDGDGILANAATHENQLIAVALLNLVMAVAVAGVAFMIYPVLRRVADTGVTRGLSLWYVGTRITESGAFLVGVLSFIIVIKSIGGNSQLKQRPPRRATRMAKKLDKHVVHYENWHADAT